MPKLGYYKPAVIHSKFFPGLSTVQKMSSSQPFDTIFTTDTPDEIETKVMRAFTGQQATKELQKRLGGNPDICAICQYYYFLFEPDDKKVEEIFEKEKKGKILAGEHKKDLAERVVKFLEEHHKKREKARDMVEKFILRD
jgi:tryptophanyl-tRNA synthetase